MAVRIAIAGNIIDSGVADSYYFMQHYNEFLLPLCH